MTGSSPSSVFMFHGVLHAVLAEVDSKVCSAHLMCRWYRLGDALRRGPCLIVFNAALLDRRNPCNVQVCLAQIIWELWACKDQLAHRRGERSFAYPCANLFLHVLHKSIGTAFFSAQTSISDNSSREKQIREIDRKKELRPNCGSPSRRVPKQLAQASVHGQPVTSQRLWRGQQVGCGLRAAGCARYTCSAVGGRADRSASSCGASLFRRTVRLGRLP